MSWGCEAVYRHPIKEHLSIWLELWHSAEGSLFVTIFQVTITGSLRDPGAITIKQRPRDSARYVREYSKIYVWNYNYILPHNRNVCVKV